MLFLELFILLLLHTFSTLWPFQKEFIALYQSTSIFFTSRESDVRGVNSFMFLFYFSFRFLWFGIPVSLFLRFACSFFFKKQHQQQQQKTEKI